MPKFPELAHLCNVELPAVLKEKLRATTLADLIIWQTDAENQKWDAPFDAGCELLQTDPEACYQACLAALEAADASVPLLSLLFNKTETEANLLDLPAIPAYFENLNARLLVSERADFEWNKPYLQVPDICVRGRLWLANELSLGSFPHILDSVDKASQLANQALLLAPTDVDALGLKTALEYLKYESGFPTYYAWLRMMFRSALTVEQLSYSYYISALVESGSPRALACYQQVTPGTEFYPHALEEAAALRADLAQELTDYNVPDFSNPVEIFFVGDRHVLTMPHELFTFVGREQEVELLSGGSTRLAEINDLFKHANLAVELEELFFFEATRDESNI